MKLLFFVIVLSFTIVESETTTGNSEAVQDQLNGIENEIDGENAGNDNARTIAAPPAPPPEGIHYHRKLYKGKIKVDVLDDKRHEMHDSDNQDRLKFEDIPDPKKNQEKSVGNQYDNEQPSLDVKKREIRQHKANHEENSHQKSRKKRQIQLPYMRGVDMDVQEAPLHFQAYGVYFRPGLAPDTFDCVNVLPIPPELRSCEEMWIYNPAHCPISDHYVKYMNVYGIPIFGSEAVPDAAMIRACYVAAVMLASRFDIRNAMRKNYLRLSIIAKSERLADKPEMQPCPSTLNCYTLRGLGPITSRPIIFGAEENMLCDPSDIYANNQDIFAHELAHAVHNYAEQVIEGLKHKLWYLFSTNVLDNGMWSGTYAASNVREYMAIVIQFYMNAWRDPGEYSAYGVTNRDTLRIYDPEITAVLDELFPCHEPHNDLIDQCAWKTGCTKEMVYHKDDFKKSNCQVLKQKESVASNNDCTKIACYSEGNVFQYRKKVCTVLLCDVVNGVINYQLETVSKSKAQNIFRVGNLPVMDFSAEYANLAALKQSCTTGPHNTEECNIPLAERKPFLDETCDNPECEEKCASISGCLDNATNSCYYPKQDCRNRQFWCRNSDHLDCDGNWPYMYVQCPLQCHICDKLDQLPVDIAGLCQDEHIYCEYWEGVGECTNNPNYMLNKCRLSCGMCELLPNPINMTEPY